ncbi:hypothetical protein ABVK25_006080 [Lepraria finkii]|uniref:Uncharacterized protein n=1 Tax=Lepraria finkii TaxID=1340010 RepID=A0ABR4B836_9LECA
MASPRLLNVHVNSGDTDAFTPAQVYYGPDKHFERGDQHGHRPHTSLHEPSSLPAFRRMSLDDTTSEPRRFLIPMDSTLKSLPSREDTDRTFRSPLTTMAPRSYL